jgi:glycerophosphoryl diester phosphodiesterase
VTSGTSPAGHPVPLVSAHRGGRERAAPGTYEAYAAALDLGADYAEFDVRQTSDRVLVAFHPARSGPGRPVAGLAYDELCAAAGYPVPRISHLIRLLAGRCQAHVDLKDPDCAAAAVTEVRRAFPAGQVVVTTRDPVLARSLCHLAPVGLTLGGDAAQTARYRLRRAWRRGISRLDGIEAAGASWAVLQERAARPALVAEARRRGLKVMVWTVNGDRALTCWLSGAGPHADVIVTDEPGRALALRSARRPGG